MSAPELAALEQLVLLCLDAAGAPLPADESAWDELLPLAACHGVAPLLWVNLQQRELPSAVRARLWAVYALNCSRNRTLQAEWDNVRAGLERRHLPVWPLKGVPLSEFLYQDAGAREVADLDILIQPRDLDAVDAALRGLGFARPVQDDLAGYRRSQELLYEKKTDARSVVALDVHLRLLPYVQRDPLTERVWASGMTNENLLVYLCGNHVSHRFARLKHMVDIARLLEREGPRLEWDAVVRAARELEFAPGIYGSLAFVAALVPGRVPEPVLAALRPSRVERQLFRWLVGRNAVAALARGPRLEGPYGSLAILASTRGFVGRLRQAGRLLFPPPAYMRQQYVAHAPQPTLPLYVSRLLRKIPLAVRDLVKAVF